MGQEKLFTIKDNNGRYVDKDSIWRNPETNEWCYTSMGGYEFDASMENLDTGVLLYGTIEKAEEVAEWLKNNIYKVTGVGSMTFQIKEITYPA